MEAIRGIVVRILKRNEESGNVFMAVQYEAAGNLVQAKLGGAARDLGEGDWFSADGEWRSSVHRGRTEEIFNAKIRSEEHTSELQSLMRISYAVFCLKKKKKKTYYPHVD